VCSRGDILCELALSILDQRQIEEAREGRERGMVLEWGRLFEQP